MEWNGAHIDGEEILSVSRSMFWAENYLLMTVSKKQLNTCRTSINALQFSCGISTEEEMRDWYSKMKQFYSQRIMSFKYCFFKQFIRVKFWMASVPHVAFWAFKFSLALNTGSISAFSGSFKCSLDWHVQLWCQTSQEFSIRSLPFSLCHFGNRAMRYLLPGSLKRTQI